MCFSHHTTHVNSLCVANEVLSRLFGAAALPSRGVEGDENEINPMQQLLLLQQEQQQPPFKNNHQLLLQQQQQQQQQEKEQ